MPSRLRPAPLPWPAWGAHHLCPACSRRILSDHATVTIHGRDYHRPCAVFTVPGPSYADER
jgi:hypothetical protein